MRIQETHKDSQFQYTVKMVDDTAESSEDSADATGPVHLVTVIMRTSSGSPSTTANSGDASDPGSGNSSE